MKINKTKLLNHFIDIKNIGNFNIFVCYENLFNKIGLRYNIEFYIISVVILLHIINIFLFYEKELSKIEIKINDIIFGKNNLYLMNFKIEEKEKEDSLTLHEHFAFCKV